MFLGFRRKRSFKYRVVRAVPGQVVRVVHVPNHPTSKGRRQQQQQLQQQHHRRRQDVYHQNTGRLLPRFRLVPTTSSIRKPLSLALPLLYSRHSYMQLDPNTPMTRPLYSPDTGSQHGGRMSRKHAQHKESRLNSTSTTNNPLLKNKYYFDNGLNNNNNNKNNNHYNSTTSINSNHIIHHRDNGLGLTSAQSVGNIVMSLREAPDRPPVSRSQSFGGHSLRSTGSLGSIGPTPVVLGETFRRSSPRAYTKAQGTLSRSGRKAVVIKVPKVPRPGRALMVFDSVKKGIGSFIQATHEDIAELMAGEPSTSTSQGRMLETDKQIKSAERYLKRLEFHLAKIDELHDCYMLHQQLREGARNMARAYNSTNSVSRKDSIASVKYGYKECSQTMCAIEAQLENMLGTFSCRLKGIAGFARLCPGDVFEVVIKHGNQKWKSKGRIDKNNTQRWDCPEFNFKCLVGDVFSIKASEVRAFKTVLLGQKNCEVCHAPNSDSGNQGLFSAHPQLMTVSVNLNGSLKLSIVITWNPMDAMDESVVFYEPPSRPPGSARRRPMSVLNPTAASLFGSNSDLSTLPDRRLSSPLQGFRQGGDDSGIYGSATSLPSRNLTQDSFPHTHSLSASPIMHGHNANLTPDMRRHLHLYKNSLPHDTRSIQSQPAQPSSSSTDFVPSARPHSSYISTAFTAVSSASPSTSTDQVMTSSTNVYLGHNILSTSPVQPIPEISQSLIPGVMVQREMVRHDSSLTVEEALGSVMTTLEDFLGQYQELQKLEEILPAIERFIRNSSSPSSRSSSMSVSIDCAIEEAFDFLNTEDTIEEVEEEEEDDKGDFVNNKRHSDVSSMDKLSPDSTAKTGDSGIELLAKRLHEDNRMGSSMGSSPIPPSTGNEQVDMALLFHLSYCDKLLENLGNFGPLKCREFYALDLLQKQAFILEKLLDIAKAGPHVDLHAVLSDMTSDKMVQELWVLCVVDQTNLYVHPDKVLSVLDMKFGQKFSEHFEMKPLRVFQHLMARILNVPVYQPDQGQGYILTLHQFIGFFSQEDGLAIIEKVALDLRMMDRLSASASDTVIKCILTLREELPAPPCLKLISRLLVGPSKEMYHSAISYLKVINRDKVKRDKAMVMLVEGLEDHLTDVRAGCCTALSIIEAEESIDQLVHVSQSDSSSSVRRKAKEALYSLGDTGRKAVESAQLGSQGFQGLQMRKL